MGEFHLKGDLPQDRASSIKGKAAEFDAAFSHARTDPTMRLQMILGAAGHEVEAAAFTAALALAKEPQEVRDRLRALNHEDVKRLARDNSKVTHNWAFLIGLILPELEKREKLSHEDDPRRIEQSG